jgi:hypothetical protein
VYPFLSSTGAQICQCCFSSQVTFTWRISLSLRSLQSRDSFPPRHRCAVQKGVEQFAQACPLPHQHAGRGEQRKYGELQHRGQERHIPQWEVDVEHQHQRCYEMDDTLDVTYLLV